MDSSSNCKNPPLMFETNDLRRVFANSFSTVFFLILVFLAFKSLIQFIRRGSSTQTELPVQQQQQQQQQQQTCSSSSQAAAAGFLAAIPVLIYEPELMDSSSSECESCSICLDGFEHGDTVRVLPRCKHMFHKDCIDKWLPSRSIFCPVCRDRTIGAEEGENLDQNDEGGRTNNCNTNGGSSSSAAPPPVIIINVVSSSISTNLL